MFLIAAICHLKVFELCIFLIPPEHNVSTVSVEITAVDQFLALRVAHSLHSLTVNVKD